MKSNDKTRVYVFYTGGTFGMAPNVQKPGNPLDPIPLDQLIEDLPDASRFVQSEDVEIELVIDTLPTPDLMDSSSMTPESWKIIASRIEENYDEFDGFIVIQGTDTLAYTASALSFMFENLGKPVVVTGSQLPIGNARTDARLNFGHALQIAAWKASDLPMIPEVVVVFADRVLRGCRTRKMSASAWTGFDSPNCPHLGEIGEHVRIFESQIRSEPSKSVRFRVNNNLVENVIDISIFPGFQAEDIEGLLKPKQRRGAVLRTYGTGNAPDDPDFNRALTKAIKEDNKVVVNITQCPQGMVEMGLYSASVGLLDAGVISGLDMTPEAALTKMMVTMGSRIGDQVKLQMQINQRGEQSQNLFDLIFPVSDWFKSEEPSDDPKSQYVSPDSRFISDDISSAVLRLDGLRTSSDSANGTLDIYLTHPNATAKDALEVQHPQRILRIPVQKSEKGSVSESLQVVQQLKKELVRSLIIPGDITLTIVPSTGVGFHLQKVSMSLFTKA